MNEGRKENDNQVFEISCEIARYLSGRKGAADTLEGLTKWWLLRQRIENNEETVKKAINILIASGKLKKRVLMDGTELYISNVDEP